MKYNDFIETEIVFDQQAISCQDPVIGCLKIKNNYDNVVFIDKIEIELILRHKGKGQTETMSLEEQIITDYNKINAGEAIVHHFSFYPTYLTTYIGKNITQQILVKTKVDISKVSEKELRNSAANKLKFASYFRGVFKPDFFNESVLQVDRGEANYEIKKAQGIINPGRNVALAILILGFVLCVIGVFVLYYKFDQDTNVISIPIIIYAIIFWLTYQFKLEPYLKIGKINFNLLNIEGNFYQANLNIEKQTRSIKEMSCQLIGMERVTYNSGKERQTATRDFYKSQPHLINRFLSKIEAKIPLPEGSFPATIKNNDFEIKWRFKILVTTKKGRKLSGTSTIYLGFENLEIINQNIEGVDFT